MTRLVCVLAALLALAPAATAGAGTVTIGSDLSADATIAESHPRDWAAWPTALAGSGGVVSPVTGEVKIAQFKGTVLKNDNYTREYRPHFVFHVVVVRPTADGLNQLVVSTEDLLFPYGGDTQQITTYDLQQYPARMCVKPGDRVALATSGGFGNTTPQYGGFPDEFYADGYPVQMFGRVPGSSIGLYEEPPGDGSFQVDGPPKRAREVTGRELLMRVTIATGDDARPFCRTAEENQGPTVAFPAQAPRLRVARGKVTLEVACVSLRACAGTLYLKQGGSAPVGSAPFSLAGRTSGPVPVPLNANGRRKLRERRGRMAVTAILRPAGGRRVEGRFKVVRR
jgi:hypothetical protein